MHVIVQSVIFWHDFRTWGNAIHQYINKITYIELLAKHVLASLQNYWDAYSNVIFESNLITIHMQLVSYKEII